MRQILHHLAIPACLLALAVLLCTPVRSDAGNVKDVIAFAKAHTVQTPQQSHAFMTQCVAGEFTPLAPPQITTCAVFLDCIRWLNGGILDGTTMNMQYAIKVGKALNLSKESMCHNITRFPTAGSRRWCYSVYQQATVSHNPNGSCRRSIGPHLDNVLRYWREDAPVAEWPFQDDSYKSVILY